MKPTTTEWSVYGETGLPAWLVAACLAAVLWTMLRWLRHECGSRPTGLKRLLPFTLAATILPAAVILWRPVLTRTQSWQHAAERLAVIDSTRSMDTPLQPASLSQQLDLVARWERGPLAGRSLAGRSLAARLLHDRLQGLQIDGGRIATAIDRAVAETEQGLPPSPEAEQAVAGCGRLAAALAGDLGTMAAAVQSAAATLPEADRPPPDAERPPLADSLALLERRVAELAAVPAAGGAAGLASPLAAALSAAAELAPGLERWQAAIDRAFVATGGERLRESLAVAGRRTRAEWARLVVETLPQGFVPVEAAVNGPISDLYGMVEAAVDGGATEDRVVSDVVLVSDGAHNGGGDDGILRRLRHRNVRFAAVSASLPGDRGTDASIADWRLPRVLTAGRPSRLRVEFKAPPGADCRLSLRVDGAADAQPLCQHDVEAGPGPTTVALVPFKPPAEGRHVLRLSLECPGDGNPANNAVLLPLDTVARGRPLLLVDDVPSWDGAWLALAAERQGIDMVQIHAAGETPKRGGLSRAIPQSLLQWTRYRGVIFDGPPFGGFDEGDAETLRKFVAEKGGTLVLLEDGERGAERGYDRLLQRAFGWGTPAAAGPRQDVPRVRIAPSAADEPCLRLAIDGPQSMRRFAALGSPARVHAVPAADVVLIETDAGDPVCTLGFHGRGRVIHWGLRGMERMREYAAAETVDRLLEELVGEAASPLFFAAAGGQSGDAVAIHPPLPRIGAACSLLVAADSQPRLESGGRAIQPAASAGGVSRFVVVPEAATQSLTLDGRSVPLRAHDNPGAELALADVDDAFLRGMAEAAGGSLIDAESVGDRLAAGAPRTYVTKTSRSWPIGRSPLLLAWMAAAATVHWVLRKLAGLAI